MPCRNQKNALKRATILKELFEVLILLEVESEHYLVSLWTAYRNPPPGPPLPPKGGNRKEQKLKIERLGLCLYPGILKRHYLSELSNNYSIIEIQL